MQRRHVLRGVVSAEGDADGAVDDCRRQVHGLQYVAAVPLGAGGAGGDVDAARLQAVDDALRAQTRQGEIDDVRGLLPADELKAGIGLLDLLAEKTQCLASKSEARRSVKENAIAINLEKVSDEKTVINADALLDGKYILVKKGKKNWFIIKAE